MIYRFVLSKLSFNFLRSILNYLRLLSFSFFGKPFIKTRNPKELDPKTSPFIASEEALLNTPKTVAYVTTKS